MGFTTLKTGPKKIGGADTVHISGPTTTFGEVATADLFPIAQGDFVHGLNEQIFNTSSFAGSTVDTQNGMVELLRQYLEPHGFRVDVTLMDWNAALTGVREGRFDAAIGVIQEEAPELWFPTKHFSTSAACFYYRKSLDWHFTGIRSLPAIRLGSVVDYYYQPSTNQYIEDNRDSYRVTEFPNPQAMYNAYMNGEIDVFLENSKVVSYHAARGKYGNDLDRSGCQTLPKYVDDLFFAFTRQPNNNKNQRINRIIQLIDQGQHKANTDRSATAIHRRYSQ